MAFAFDPVTGLNDLTQFPDADPLIRSHLQAFLQQIPNYYDAQLALKANIAQPGYTIPTLLNGTQNQDSSTYNGIAFRKDTVGVVHFKGVITVTATNTIVCNLPVGYRPLKVHYFIVPTGTGGTFATGSVTVYPNGDVKFTNGTLSYIDLSQIYFDAEQ